MPTTIYVSQNTTAQALQGMIDAAGADTNFVLEAGNYFFDQTIIIRNDGVTISGAGSGSTVINVAASIGDESLFQFGHRLHKPEISDRLDLVTPAYAGGSTVELQSGHGLVAGDFLYFSQDNTSDFLDSIGDTSWRKSKDLRTQLVEVTAVNGNQITFDAALTFDYDPAITEVQVRDIIHGVGLTGLTIVGPYGTADASDFSNTISGGLGQTMVLFAGTANAFAADIEIIDGISHGITIANSREITIQDFSMDGTHNKGASGNGYALWIRDVYEGLFTDLNIVDTRHAVLFASYTSASGNEVEVTYTNRDINFHGGLDQFNTVVVDAMIRNPAEQKYLSTAVSYNSGSSWGAPTDPTTNAVTFKQLVASNKDEYVVSHADGSVISTVDGDDTVETGVGNDVVDTGRGKDVIIASGGLDRYDGGSGDDLVIFSGDIADFNIVNGTNGVTVQSQFGITTIQNVEQIQFNDAVLDIENGDAVVFVPPPVPSPAAPGEADLFYLNTWLDDTTIEAGDTTKVRLHVSNQGGVEAQGHSDFFWSADDTFDAGDIWIDEDRHGTLKVDEIDTNEREKLDDDLLEELGSGYIFAVLDFDGTIDEADETNNVSDAMYLEVI